MSKTILLVEDDEPIAKAFTYALESKKYKVIRVSDGNKAFDAAKTEQPDLILLDIMMPGKTGEEVIEQLKADDATKNIPVIVDSNLYSAERESFFMHKGAVGYVVKANLTPDDLIKLVESVN